MKKEISLSHMISTLVLAAALVGVYRDIDNRQVRVEAEVSHLQSETLRMEASHGDRLNRIRAEQRETSKAVDARLDKILAKLDRLIERRLNRTLAR